MCLQNVERAKSDLVAALRVLDAHLETRTFLVSERVTLADIAVFTTLIHAFQVPCPFLFNFSSHYSTHYLVQSNNCIEYV